MMKKGGLLHKIFRIKEKQLYRVSDYIGCMSPANVDFILSHNPDLDPKKVEVNPNSIAPVLINVALGDKNLIRDKYRIPKDAVVFLYGGNLGKPQGIDFLIEVLETNINRKNVSFIIVGGGTEYNVVDKWYKKNQPINILLLQSLPKDYDELIKACDVGLIFLDKRFTIPNFPSRLLSYLEHKMPVLAATDKNTDIGKIIEEAGCGFWVESGDLGRFNELLGKFEGNKELLKLMGENSYKILMKEYTVDVAYSSVINKLK